MASTNQLWRLAKLVVGGLTGDRRTIRDAAAGDEDAVEDIVDQGDAVITELGSRARRIANADGSRRKTTLNAGQPARLRTRVDAPVEVPADVVEVVGEPTRARRASR